MSRLLNLLLYPISHGVQTIVYAGGAVGVLMITASDIWDGDELVKGALVAVALMFVDAAKESIKERKKNNE